MTLSDLCEYLGKAELTVSRNFPKVQETMRKRGIIITKDGRGNDADYTIVFPDGTQID